MSTCRIKYGFEFPYLNYFYGPRYKLTIWVYISPLKTNILVLLNLSNVYSIGITRIESNSSQVFFLFIVSITPGTYIRSKGYTCNRIHYRHTSKIEKGQIWLAHSLIQYRFLFSCHKSVFLLGFPFLIP